MRTCLALGVGLAGFCALGITATAAGEHDRDHDIVLRATARGAEEVPPNNTPATARFRAVIHDDGMIDFTLSFADLSAPLTVSHIHFGQTKVSGGVMIFLCGGGNQPACPAATAATITGQIVANNVTGPAAQGVTPGDLASALRIIVQQGEGYVNLHNSMFPAGEIRGQVQASRH
jgi:hypothetical protein